MSRRHRPRPAWPGAPRRAKECARPRTHRAERPRPGGSNRPLPRPRRRGTRTRAGRRSRRPGRPQVNGFEHLTGRPGEHPIATRVQRQPGHREREAVRPRPRLPADPGIRRDERARPAIRAHAVGHDVRIRRAAGDGEQLGGRLGPPAQSARLIHQAIGSGRARRLISDPIGDRNEDPVDRDHDRGLPAGSPVQDGRRPRARGRRLAARARRLAARVRSAARGEDQATDHEPDDKTERTEAEDHSCQREHPVIARVGGTPP